MKYEWDNEKCAANLKNHGLSFEDAHWVFASPCVTFLDDRFNYGEPRFITLGTLQAGCCGRAHTQN